ncbi:MAG: hypothetical protein JNM93_07570 [Bacteriovoracaceae bacterium]|nr:hypothetical protein [Bacteriovoracaceae bacterium]
MKKLFIALMITGILSAHADLLNCQDTSGKKYFIKRSEAAQFVKSRDNGIFTKPFSHYEDRISTSLVGKYGQTIIQDQNGQILVRFNLHKPIVIQSEQVLAQGLLADNFNDHLRVLNSDVKGEFLANVEFKKKVNSFKSELIKLNLNCILED